MLEVKYYAGKQEGVFAGDYCVLLRDEVSGLFDLFRRRAVRVRYRLAILFAAGEHFAHLRVAMQGNGNGALYWPGSPR